jgi:hypothetical protein
MREKLRWFGKNVEDMTREELLEVVYASAEMMQRERKSHNEDIALRDYFDQVKAQHASA